MDNADLEFIYEMVEQLDATINKLTMDEKNIRSKIGMERIEELREYWQQELSDEDAEELKTTFDHWDRTIISTWAHLLRAHKTRAQAGQALMKDSNAP